MGNKAIITALLLSGFILVTTAITAVSVVAERSLTLARVREADFQMVSLLLAAARPESIESLDINAVQDSLKN